MKTNLEAKVEAVNQVNAEINRVAPLFREAVKPFIGKKVLKAGGFTEQLKKVFPEIKAWQWYRNGSDYSLSITIRACINYGEHYACYHEASFYFGEVKDQVLVGVECDSALRKCDYTPEYVREKRKALDDATEAMRKAEFELSPFSRYDN
jgi:hypothetical protein